MHCSKDEMRRSWQLSTTRSAMAVTHYPCLPPWMWILFVFPVRGVHILGGCDESVRSTLLTVIICGGKYVLPHFSIKVSLCISIPGSPCSKLLLALCNAAWQDNPARSLAIVIHLQSLKDAAPVF